MKCNLRSVFRIGKCTVRTYDDDGVLRMHSVAVWMEHDGRWPTEVMVSEYGHFVRCTECAAGCWHEDLVRKWREGWPDKVGISKLKGTFYDQDAVVS